ncbi:MAG: ABC transporter substrate-binding protein [Candidatus Binatia bacterium]
MNYRKLPLCPTVVICLLAILSPVTLQAGVLAHTKRLIEGAKKEGKVVWYTTMTISESKPMLERFEKKYPFIKAELFRTGGGPLLNRMMSEARAGRHLFDVVNTRAEAFLTVKKAGLIAKYKSPERSMVEDDLKDREGYWTASYGIALVLGYNTEQVKPADVPRSYQALLEPRWKGKILNDTENFHWFSGLLRAWGREKGLAYMRRLAAQDQTFMRGNTARVQLVTAGEKPLLIAYNHTIQRMKSRGGPIDWVPLEPVVFTSNVFMYARGGPNPNAGKLLIDFLLSKEGQEMIRGFNRITVRKDLDPNPPRLSRGFKRFVLTPEQYDDYNEIVKLYRKVFKID